MRPNLHLGTHCNDPPDVLWQASFVGTEGKEGPFSDSCSLLASCWLVSVCFWIGVIVIGVRTGTLLCPVLLLSFTSFPVLLLSCACVLERENVLSSGVVCFNDMQQPVLLLSCSLYFNVPVRCSPLPPVQLFLPVEFYSFPLPVSFRSL